MRSWYVTASRSGSCARAQRTTGAVALIDRPSSPLRVGAAGGWLASDSRPERAPLLARKSRPLASAGETCDGPPSATVQCAAPVATSSTRAGAPSDDVTAAIGPAPVWYRAGLGHSQHLGMSLASTTTRRPLGCVQRTVAEAMSTAITHSRIRK